MRDLPEGLIVDAAWLDARGYSAALRSQYLRAGWLEQPARRVYRRPRGNLRWEQVVISLQTLLGLPVSVGGRTALELQGYGHYLPQSSQVIHLYADRHLPRWLHNVQLANELVVHNRTRLFPATLQSNAQHSLSIHEAVAQEQVLDGALRLTRWGASNWPLIMSTPERAILELLDELPARETFHNVDVTIEGLVNISPQRMQTLLEQTRSVKVKRLFFFFAERHGHSWESRIARDAIDLGKGKRVIAKNGKLNRAHQITVPEEFDGVR